MMAPLVRRIVVFLFVLALFGYVAFDVFIEPKIRVQAVRKHFAGMPNVKLTYISDLSKQASDNVTADIEVAGKGPMQFEGVTPKSFLRSPYIYLKGIGPWSFRTREQRKTGGLGGHELFGYSIMIGNTSPIPEVRRLGITNIRSAVTHYDELLSLIEKWPVTQNEWPAKNEEVHFADSIEGDYYFCLKRADLKSTQAPLGYPWKSR